VTHFQSMNSNSAFHLLVIEDDPMVVEALRLILPKSWRMTATRHMPPLSESSAIHAALIDMHLNGPEKADGPDFIKSLHQRLPTLEIMAMSGDLSLDLMELCLKNGARKFLAKPLRPEEILGNLEKIEALWQMRDLESRGGRKLAQWVGASPTSEQVRREVARLRGEKGPILVEGETGTGKEVVFRMLNQQEPNRPAVTVNIASIPETLFESELFGHVKGAFTGADSHRMGLAEAAQGGDLFLDEIEALPLTQQVKLLRFLETGEIRKVGAKDSITVQVRVIAASNQNLAQLVKEQKFREDLLYRLNGKMLRLPPLRDRREDIPELTRFFLEAQGPRNLKTLSPGAIQALQNYKWPGNVRELKRVCEQLALVAPLPILRQEDVQSLTQPAAAATATVATESHSPTDLHLGLEKLLNQFEAQILIQALKQCQSDVEKTASLLQISRSNLYQKIKTHQLQDTK